MPLKRPYSGHNNKHFPYEQGSEGEEGWRVLAEVAACGMPHSGNEFSVFQECEGSWGDRMKWAVGEQQ